MLHNGRYVKYLPVKDFHGIYGMKVKRSQEHFSYFHNLFTSPTGPLYHIIEYLSPRTDMELIDVHVDSDDYIGGVGKLQSKENGYYNDFCIYEFHTHNPISEKSSTKEEILKKYKRTVSIEALLD